MNLTTKTQETIERYAEQRQGMSVTERECVEEYLRSELGRLYAVGMDGNLTDTEADELDEMAALFDEYQGQAATGSEEENDPKAGDSFAVMLAERVACLICECRRLEGVLEEEDVPFTVLDNECRQTPNAFFTLYLAMMAELRLDFLALEELKGREDGD